MDGVRLFFEHPIEFVRDCEKCRRFLLDDRNEVARDQTGAPIERGNVPPGCDLCARHEAGFEDGWIGVNGILFEQFLACWLFGALPRAGGLDDQDPDELAALVRMGMAARSYDRKFQADMGGAMMAAMFGAKV